MPGYYANNELKHSSLHVNSNEKGTGMRNTGLKMPEKDKIYVLVGFSYYYRVKIIGKRFSILCFKC